MFNKYKINAHSALTAASLAMRVFKTHFMSSNTICQLHGNIEKAIRLSYTGGAVDLYIPHNKIGSYMMSKIHRKLYCYDANALYPTVMSTQLMPVGFPIAFEGNIRAMEADAYGFFYCKMTSPEYLEHPILQRKIETSDGMRTVAGLGSWLGWINSAEMDNAMKFCYTFQIFKGYQFEVANIFKGYSTSFYNLRLQYPKGDPMNLISKDLNNSLYGKFGMKPEKTKVEFYKVKSEQDILKFKGLLDQWVTTVQDWIQLEDHLFVIREVTLDAKTDPENNVFHGTEVNVALASAIT
jgi:hypothetical protein